MLIRAQKVIPVILVAPLLLAACATQGGGDDAQPGPETVRGISMAVELDPDSGAIVLPFDKFRPSFNDELSISSAQSVELIECAREAGVPVGEPTPPVVNPIYDSEHYFGPWTVGQARQFGFVEPMSDRDLVANGIDGAPEASARPGGDKKPPFANLTESESAIVDSCQTTHGDQFRRALTQDGPWVQEIRSISDRVQSLELAGAQSVMDELLECYEDRGLRTGDRNRPWIPQGANLAAINEEQIALALTVVECKEETQFVARMARIEGNEQARVIDAYADELANERADLEETRTIAQGLLREHGLLNTSE